MKDILAAIQTKYTGSALDAATNGLFLGRAPEGAALPYLVIPYVQEVHSNAEPNLSYEDFTVQISAFSASTGASEILDLFEKVKSLFDEASLSLSSHTLVRMRRLRDRLLPEPLPERGWGLHVDYLIETDVN
ncbi:MAG: DUF3168 domain-containing protein [Armatimonadetes bacterium]|nr:DUF3168 domain-containing protein [Armatimonadota bacterium]